MTVTGSLVYSAFCLRFICICRLALHWQTENAHVKMLVNNNNDLIWREAKRIESYGNVVTYLSGCFQGPVMVTSSALTVSGSSWMLRYPPAWSPCMCTSHELLVVKHDLAGPWPTSDPRNRLAKCSPSIGIWPAQAWWWSQACLSIGHHACVFDHR